MLRQVATHSSRRNLRATTATKAGATTKTSGPLRQFPPVDEKCDGTIRRQNQNCHPTNWSGEGSVSSGKPLAGPIKISQIPARKRNRIVVSELHHTHHRVFALLSACPDRGTRGLVHFASGRTHAGGLLGLGVNADQRHSAHSAADGNHVATSPQVSFHFFG